MKYIFIAIAMLLTAHLCYAQKASEKPVIDTSMLTKWPNIAWANSLTNKCNFGAYVINNIPVGGSTLVIRSIVGDWQREFTEADCKFTSDSKYAVINLAGDSLCIYTLGTDHQEYITHVSGSKLQTFHNEDWLAYQINNPEKELVLHNLVTGAVRRYQGVNQFEFSKNGQTLVMQAQDHHDSTVTYKLDLLDMQDGNLSSIWQGEGVPQRTIISPSGRELAFFIRNIQHGEAVTRLWSYRQGESKAKLLVDENTQGITANLGLSPEQLIFSKDGSRVFFKLVEQHLPEPKPDAVKVDIWNYKDGDLQSGQLVNAGPRLFEAVVNLDDGKLIRLQQEDDVLFGAQYEGQFNERTLLMLKYKRAGANDGEWYWSPNARPSIILVDTRDGSRKLVKENVVNFYCFTISADGRWLVYYDQEQQAYLSYDIESGTSRNLVKKIPVSWTLKVDGNGNCGGIPTPGLMGPFLPLAEFAGWQDDGTVWVYDEYDIWQLDPSGTRPPFNITNGYGRKHHIRFRAQDVFTSAFIVRTEPERSKWLLNAFDTETKYSGFYKLANVGKGDPEKLVMGPWRSFSGKFIVKAKDTCAWMVQMESAAVAPNYFITYDLKTFAQLSNLQPQKQYNWLTVELHHWRTQDGVLSTGILYKPENFDPYKKYPVLFNYYEKRSDELYYFQEPKASADNINIPYFVSRGYLVFVPDIHFKVGSSAGKITDCIVSAAKYIARLPYVDKKRMGIEGISHGGYETNVLVTHSHLFAAAVSIAGCSDLISEYGGLKTGGERFLGSSSQPFVETSAARIGANLWQRPDLFIENSPIFQADRVTTPTLIVHGEKDDNVKFEQSIEFYTALRRLGKKVWMLQYDEDTHGMTNAKDAMDLTMRMTQFFDHYLQDAPPPKWMTEGVPARLKGIETGLGLDTSGKQP